MDLCVNGGINMESETTTAPAVIETIQEKVEQASGFFSGISDYFKAALPLIIIAVIVLIVGIVLIKLITKIISAIMKRSAVDNAARKFIVSVIRTILYLIVVVIALSIINVPMTSVITIIGAAGLAASLALQNCLTNLCGGFVILFSKPFAAGDTVELDGTVGIVREIGILNTKLHTFDGKTVLIPNGNVTAAKLINYTDTPTRRVDLNIDISYTSDFLAARQLMRKPNDIAGACPGGADGQSQGKLHRNRRPCLDRKRQLQRGLLRTKRNHKTVVRQERYRDTLQAA